MTVPVISISLADGPAGELDLGRVRASLAREGYAYVRDVPEDFDYVGQLSRLGAPAAQFDGAIVREVRPEPTVDNTVFSASNTRELMPHTEWFEYPGHPPRYVALWCVRQTEGPGGETTLADAYSFVRTLTARDREHLLSSVYPWQPSAVLRKLGIDFHADHPLLERHGGDVIVRFPCDDRCARFDDLMERFLTAGREYFAAHHVAVKIEERAVLVWDNWRMMHARNAFTDEVRHLRRLLVSATV
ncbi:MULTISPECIES: TauD/TfdA family dioxygenase [Streptomycetaceae]|jgi:alpha-ketoglutarate-dependent taurine dioxygenase|uniref:TauD/TfdA family dioxygenase n=1 Tax=Streptomycetaceae TaxID=2062 RepID=UPI00300B74FA